MSKETKKGMVPKLRFPEFREAEEWQRTTIGEVGTFYYGKSAPKWSLSNDAPTPCVRYGELYTKFDTIISEIFSRTNIDPSNLRFSKGGEILVPRVGEVPQDFAKNCCYLPFPNIAIGEMISVYETEEYPIFYAYYFRTLWRQFAQVVEGQNVKNLYYVNLEPIVVGKPSFLEQQKIAACLSSLDDLIAAQSRKVEALKTHKKGLMQQLFPAEGETAPRLRFAEFREAGEWEERALGDKEVALFVKEKTPLEKLELESYISTENLLPDYAGATKASKLPPSGSFTKFKAGDILISNIRPYLKKVWVADRIGAASNDIIVVRASSAVTDSFLSFILKNDSFINYVMEGAKGLKMPRGDKSLMEGYRIVFPNIVEQQKIADCLSSLDDLIAAQNQKLEAFKAHKKGLMQGLFPNDKEMNDAATQ